MLNATEIQTLTPEQFILAAHQSTAIIPLILLFVITAFIFLGVGLVMSNNKEKLFKIWLISSIFSLIFLLVFIFMPLLTQSIIHLFS